MSQARCLKYYMESDKYSSIRLCTGYRNREGFSRSLKEIFLKLCMMSILTVKMPHYGSVGRNSGRHVHSIIFFFVIKSCRWVSALSADNSESYICIVYRIILFDTLHTRVREIEITIDPCVALISLGNFIQQIKDNSKFTAVNSH